MPEPEALPNPLLEAKPDSLSELMARDPLKMTEQNRHEIVKEIRRMREIWDKAEKEGKTRAPKVAKAAKPTLSLDDLEL